MADLAAIQAKYPAFAYLINDPEIGALIGEATDKPMDDATFQARLMATNWWKSNNLSQRNWNALLNTDPAQAQIQINDRYSQVAQTLASMGYTPDTGLISEITNWSLQTGNGPDSPGFKGYLNEIRTQRGVRSTNTGQLTAIANNEYMIHMDDPTIQWWAGQIAQGNQTEQSYRSSLATLAAGRFPTLADSILNRGLTPGAYFGPIKATIAKEMDYSSAEQVDLFDPRWSKALGFADEKGNIRPMTTSEAITLARGQEDWKQTRNGQALAGQLTQNLLKTFGEV